MEKKKDNANFNMGLFVAKHIAMHTDWLKIESLYEVIESTRKENALKENN